MKSAKGVGVPGEVLAFGPTVIYRKFLGNFIFYHPSAFH